MKNDERILGLREQIASKRKEVGTARRFEPETNCSLVMSDNERYNLHTVTKELAMALLVRLNAFRLSAADLDFKDWSISGYPVETWIADLKARLAYLENAQERKRLDVLESQLERLLSEEKQTELAIDAIAKSL